MDYYSKRLGGSSLGDVESLNAPGIGFASASEKIQNVIEAAPEDPLAEIMRKRQALISATQSAALANPEATHRAVAATNATAEEPDEVAALTKEMTQAVNDGNPSRAGFLKKKIDELTKPKGKKKGSFMSRQLKKIKQVQQVNEQQRQEERQLEQMDGPRGDFIRFQREVEQISATGSGQRGDDFFAISCNAHRAV